jgi:hypothetical protein
LWISNSLSFSHDRISVPSLLKIKMAARWRLTLWKFSPGCFVYSIKWKLLSVCMSAGPRLLLPSLLPPTMKP